MTCAFFLRQLLLLLAGFAVLNLLVTVRSRHFPAQQVARALDASPPVTDLFLGNSLMAAGLDPAAYARAAPGTSPLNGALGSTSPVEHDLLLRRALHARPRRVFYGFFDGQLTERPSAAFAELAGNHTPVFFLDRETAIRFLCPDDPFAAWRIRLVAWLPLVYERMNFWAKVELARRWLGDFGLPEQAAGVFGRHADFARLDAEDAATFGRECADAARHWTGFIAPVNDMVDLARRQEAVFYFVEMPMPTAHRQRYYATPGWAAYADAVHRQAAAAGARFINASDWVGDDGEFEDAWHLNARGAAEFSRRLAAAAR